MAKFDTNGNFQVDAYSKGVKMKVYNDNQYTTVHKDLLTVLDYMRQEQKQDLVSNDESPFVPDLYVKEKVKMLNNYLTKCGLDAVLIAISGGVDSALVLKLAEAAKNEPNSPLKKIYAVTLPIYDSVLTNQSDTVKRAEDVMKNTDCEALTIDMRNIYDANVQTAQTYGFTADNWSNGQMGAYVRTSFLYYLTAVINAQGYKPILLGTTNRDEGSYLGYVGKASDGMVDVQVISDIYKSEVYQVAEYLKVPESILGVTPNGDMYDGRVDTEVFGAPYTMVELFNRIKAVQVNPEHQHPLFDIHVSPEAKDEWNQYATNLEKLHRYNAHKYLGLSPAVHLDLWSTEVKGGYINYAQRTKDFLQQ